MRKLSIKYRKHYLSLEKKRRHEEKISAGIRRQRWLKNRIMNLGSDEYYSIRLKRELLKKELYKKRAYKGEAKTISIDQEFGLEEQIGSNYFLELANSFIDLNPRRLILNLQKCTRVWPSAIMLLCSLMEWVELTRPEHHKPTIASSASSDDKVNSYLAHSGFYDYVHRQKDANINEGYYEEKNIVKIRRETHPSNIEDREDEIILLMESHSSLKKEEIELFYNTVLIEVFNNLTEHGVPNKDAGWWVLGQYHPTHKIISLCFADNGIGIRNSLMTGPQGDYISKRIKNDSQEDGEFIKLALEETVSGALAAPVREGRIIKKYPRGSRRGHGLKIIKNTCKKLNIPFSILSHHGYIFIDKDGSVINYGAKSGRVFAGTFYHFNIPTN